MYTALSRLGDTSMYRSVFFSNVNCFSVLFSLAEIENRFVQPLFVRVYKIVLLSANHFTSSTLSILLVFISLINFPFISETNILQRETNAIFLLSGEISKFEILPCVLYDLFISRVSFLNILMF